MTPTNAFVQRIVLDPPLRHIDKTCMGCAGRGMCMTLNPEWLRHVRERAGLSLREVARRCRVSATYLCDIEHGRRNCPVVIEQTYAAL